MELKKEDMVQDKRADIVKVHLLYQQPIASYMHARVKKKKQQYHSLLFLISTQTVHQNNSISVNINPDLQIQNNRISSNNISIMVLQVTFTLSIPSTITSQKKVN
jgi:hypothetical protein